VLRTALTAPRGVVASVAPHLKSHESASSAPAPQTQVVRPAQAQYLPPHLRRSIQVEAPDAAKPIQSQAQSVVSAQAQSVPPHLRGPTQVAAAATSKLAQSQSAVPSQATAVPPHLRGSVQVSPPQMAIHQTAPHLQGISSHQASQLSATQVNNNLIAAQVATTMASSFNPPPRRPANDGQDDFLSWLNHRKPVQKAKATETATIKPDEPLKSVRSPQALPVQSPQVSPSKQSINSKWSRESGKNINDTDDFISYMQKPKTNPKVYGAPLKSSKSPKQASPNNGWQAPRTAFDHPHWKLNEDSVANFETFIKTGASASLAIPAVQGNSVHGTANVRAAKAQAAQAVTPKVQHAYQKPTFVGAQKLGQNPSQPKPIVQNGPAQLIENKKPVAQVPVKIGIVASNLNNIAPKKPATPADAAPLNAAEWKGMPSMQSVAAMISSDINTVQPQTSSNIPALTNEALVLTTGFKTVNQYNYSDDRISSAGLGKNSSDHAQDPRHTQGNDMVNQFFEWDGSRAPAPIWEEERPSFDDSFIPEYIKEWQKTLPSGQFKVDIDDDKFTSGVCPITNVIFVDPIDQGPDTIPGKCHDPSEDAADSNTS